MVVGEMGFFYGVDLDVGYVDVVVGFEFFERGE